MISADTIRLLIEAGVTGEALLRVVESIEKGNAVTVTPVTRVTYNAEKQARYRARKKVTAVTRVTVTPVTPPSPFPETKAPTPLKTQPLSSTQESIPNGIPKKPQTTPRVELETVLDPEHAAAVLEHRQRLGSPMTARAAKALAKQFAKTPDPNAAVETMLARGWQGFEPEWLETRTRPNGTGPPRKLRGSAALSELASRPFHEVFGNIFDEPSVHADRDPATRNGR